ASRRTARIGGCRPAWSATARSTTAACAARSPEPGSLPPALAGKAEGRRRESGAVLFFWIARLRPLGGPPPGGSSLRTRLRGPVEVLRGGRGPRARRRAVPASAGRGRRLGLVAVGGRP